MKAWMYILHGKEWQLLMLWMTIFRCQGLYNRIII